MKKSVKHISEFLFLSLASLPFVSASALSERVTETMRDTVDAGISIFGPLFEAVIGNYETDQFLFAKSLLVILLFVIIYAVVKKVPAFKANKGISVIVALIVSILAVRFISENDLVNGILLPYGTLGVALTTILPFLIFFYFVHDGQMGSLGRRICWLFFGIIFLVLFGYKFDSLGVASQYIYIFSLIGVIIAFIFDSSIHKYFGLAEDSRIKRERKDKKIADIDVEINRLETYGSDSPENRRAIERLENLKKRVRSE